MLLTLKQPQHNGFKSFHDYSPPTPPSTSRFSPALTNAVPSFSRLSPVIKPLHNPSMSTPHRGLPPPAAMTLPQPSQGPPPLGQPPSLGQPMGPLPAPPQQWQGAEESMRNWLHAKAEEDKRKQEEEKTRQESLRLEQRKIEQDMLRTSLGGGIPPYMIPMVFAGMGGGNLPNASLEWAQHYMAQTHHAQQQQQQQQQQQLQHQAIAPAPHSPPDMRRDTRQITQAYGSSQHPMPAPLPSTPVVGSGPSSSGFLPSYAMSPSSRSRTQLPGPEAMARGPPVSQLPRLNTGEMQIQPPSQGPPQIQVLPGQSTHPLHQSQSSTQSQQEPQSSPSIYFHHWQPPTSQTAGSGSIQPTTPSDALSSSSPRKRKAQGPQQAAPPPTSQPQYISPSFSTTGSSVSNTPSTMRRRHSRQRSDPSSRGLDNYGRPSSRHRHTESGPSRRSPDQQQGYDPAREASFSGHQHPKAEPSASQSYQPHYYEQSSSTGSEMRRSERRSTEKDGDRE